MQISVVRIGNSRGIRLPKSILDNCEIEDTLELEVHGHEIVLKPHKKSPRQNWGRAFQLMRENNDDLLVLDEIVSSQAFTWEW